MYGFKTTMLRCSSSNARTLRILRYTEFALSGDKKKDQFVSHPYYNTKGRINAQQSFCVNPKSQIIKTICRKF